MTSIKDILKRPFTYQLVLKEQIIKTKNLLNGIKQETHGEKRRFYEKRMEYIEMHVDTINKIKQRLEPYLRDTSIQKIDEYFDELLQLFNEIVKELNKSRISTLETIVHEKLKNPGINVDENQYFFVPSIGKDTQITHLLTERERKDDEDYLGGSTFEKGGKKNRRTTMRKRTIKMTRKRITMRTMRRKKTTRRRIRK
jgi:hypothetical protein